jgi:DNA-binding MarR family transcriptional regulator
MNALAGDSARARALAAELRLVFGRLKRRLREQSPPGDLNWSQHSVLSLLEREGPATVTRLARTEGMRSQSMGAIVAALEGAGLVSGSPDPADGRQTLWSPTAAAREWLRIGRAAREDWLIRSIEARLTPAQQAELGRALELMQKLADA